MTTHRDDKRGHFILTLPYRAGHDNGRAPEVVGAELGPTLHITASGAHLTPEEARALADALTWWADRKHGTEARIEQEGEPYDLLALLDGERP